VETVEFGAGTPYGVYDAELFLHLPLLLTQILLQNNSFDAAIAMSSYVLDIF
jgi:hypothetical protein